MEAVFNWESIPDLISAGTHCYPWHCMPLNGDEKRRQTTIRCENGFSEQLPFTGRAVRPSANISLETCLFWDAKKQGVPLLQTVITDPNDKQTPKACYFSEQNSRCMHATFPRPGSWSWRIKALSAPVVFSILHNVVIKEGVMEEAVKGNRAPLVAA